MEICQWLHRLGVVWGDVKPENFVEGQARFLDTHESTTCLRSLEGQTLTPLRVKLRRVPGVSDGGDDVVSQTLSGGRLIADAQLMRVSKGSAWYVYALPFS